MKILTAFALPQEVISLSSSEHEVQTLVTGVGKAWAGILVTQAINRWRPDAVINIGTAGTLRHSVGDIVVATRFVDRNYEQARIPGLEWEISTVCPALARFSSRLGGTTSEEIFTVNTGDDFVTAADRITGDVVDMEAYAEALACRLLNVPFVSVKYVTDIIGQNSVKHWEDKLEEARLNLEDYFKQLIQ